MTAATAIAPHRAPGRRPARRGRRARLALTYLVPLRTGPGADLGDLVDHLALMADVVEDVVVVDGSDPPDVAAHRRALDARIRVLVPEAPTPMGKVGGVLTGLRHARGDKVVIADDDVRYIADDLARMDELLDLADVVRPQNRFEPARWHTHLDTARIVWNRALGGDWPGTLGVRRDVVLAAGGYAGDVMFENLELVRTVRAAGGRELLALDLIIARRPPTTTHFRRQQVRQAYDELARPWRLVPSLLVLPLTLLAAGRRRWWALAGASSAAVAVAELGRRRAGGASVFARRSSLLAPLWLLVRSCCSYAALGAWVRGGVRYRDVRLRRAATPNRHLRRTVPVVDLRTAGPGRPPAGRRPTAMPRPAQVEVTPRELAGHR